MRLRVADDAFSVVGVGCGADQFLDRRGESRGCKVAGDRQGVVGGTFVPPASGQEVPGAIVAVLGTQPGLEPGVVPCTCVGIVVCQVTQMSVRRLEAWETMTSLRLVSPASCHRAAQSSHASEHPSSMARR